MGIGSLPSRLWLSRTLLLIQVSPPQKVDWQAGTRCNIPRSL